jgi:hypothetical protein
MAAAPARIARREIRDLAVLRLAVSDIDFSSSFSVVAVSSAGSAATVLAVASGLAPEEPAYGVPRYLSQRGLSRLSGGSRALYRHIVIDRDEKPRRLAARNN